MEYKYSIFDLSEYIIYYCNAHKIKIDYVRLNFILFYIQFDLIINHNIVAFEDSIEASDIGPIIFDVYTYYKKEFINKKIINKLSEVYLKSIIPCLVIETCNKKIKYLKDINNFELSEMSKQLYCYQSSYLKGLNIEINKIIMGYDYNSGFK